MIQDINILKIRTESRNFYIFDGISNNIYKVNQDDYARISNQDFEGRSGVRDLSLSSTEIKKQVSSNAKTLIIELTEKCNLRCKYCVFDEENKNSERKHGKKTVDISEVKKNVERFYGRANKNEAFIVFYGGEPLLEIETIKEIVEYSNTLSNKKIKYSLTTNGTVFNKESTQFLVDNDFTLTISIDGPEAVNDKYRIKKNKQGTWRTILKSLKKIKKDHPQFYRERVAFNCVINNKEEIEDINNFFENSKIIDHNKVRFSAEISKSLEINESTSKRAISLFHEKGYYRENIPPIENGFMGILIDKINYRKLDQEAPKGKKNCIPFANRTYIRAGGEIQFCERIQNYSIIKDDTANLEEISQRIHEEFNKFKENDCSKCFAYNFCEMCPASFLVNGALSKDISIKKCSAFRNDIKSAISLYIDKKELEEEK
ncbi:MAG: radical SAM protein [Methyloprofundus sp.]|nr:radical SAM protein [Methyloprofundus sp.]